MAKILVVDDEADLEAPVSYTHLIHRRNHRLGILPRDS